MLSKYCGQHSIEYFASTPLAKLTCAVHLQLYLAGTTHKHLPLGCQHNMHVHCHVPLLLTLQLLYGPCSGSRYTCTWICATQGSALHVWWLSRRLLGLYGRHCCKTAACMAA